MGRITPAHAGKSTSTAAPEIPARDHPRTRGEKNLLAFLDKEILGSPPHTRGKDNNTVTKADSVRITPAHAGKSFRPLFGWGRAQDHPRTRGEKGSIQYWAETVVGSPPHTRGKEVALDNQLPGEGITPAHAGKSRTGKPSSRLTRDHPRTRGEKGFHACEFPLDVGSPPHTRGKVSMSINAWYSVGITPAHAGKSDEYIQSEWVSQDHPRTRGEKSATACRSGSSWGSPPHTRGKDESQIFHNAI